MKTGTLILGLCAAAFCVYEANAAQKFCPGLGRFSTSPPFSHLPLPECTAEMKMSFKLYTRQYTGGVAISRTNIPRAFVNSRKTTFIIHGYRNEGGSEWVVQTRQELLKRADMNVIVVDWTQGARNVWYPLSASNTRVVGMETGLLARALRGRGLSRANLWCVGHSLGGHTCGHTGKTEKFGRITGLDPAGPMFENYPNAAGLQPTDADFVDVIHSMGTDGPILDFGTLKPLGHADFYPNGGAKQPGCYGTGDSPGTTGDIGCAHGRACTYFIESINSRCKFNVKQACSNERNLPGSCRSCNSCQTMGYDVKRARGKFYLTTNGRNPFCRG